jgi:hypothetical protein
MSKPSDKAMEAARMFLPRDQAESEYMNLAYLLDEAAADARRQALSDAARVSELERLSWTGRDNAQGKEAVRRATERIRALMVAPDNEGTDTNGK